MTCVRMSPFATRICCYHQRKCARRRVYKNLKRASHKKISHIAHPFAGNRRRRRFLFFFRALVFPLSVFQVDPARLWGLEPSHSELFLPVFFSLFWRESTVRRLPDRSSMNSNYVGGDVVRYEGYIAQKKVPTRKIVRSSSSSFFFFSS